MIVYVSYLEEAAAPFVQQEAPDIFQHHPGFVQAIYEQENQIAPLS